MNYASLLQSIQDWLENDEAVFVAEIPLIVPLVERRILSDVQLPVNIKNQTGSMTIGNNYLTTPSDYLYAYSLAIYTNGEYSYLTPVDVSYIREAFPSSTATAQRSQPTHYGQFDHNSFIIGPSPDIAYTVELHYAYLPETIVSASTTWLGDNAEDALLWGCITEAYAFMKGEQDMLATYQQKYDRAIEALRYEYEGHNMRDAHRGGKVRDRL